MDTVEPTFISQSEQFEILSSTQNIRCKNDSTGEITLYPFGGFEPYQFVWNDGATVQNRTKLVAGTYNVVVTDANSSTQSLSVSIEPGISPEPVITITPATCAAGIANQDGQILIANFSPDDRYDFSQAATYTGSATSAGTLPVIPENGVITRIQPNPQAPQPYTVRVFNNRDCFTDVTATMPVVSCGCQTSVCVPITIRRLK